MVETTRARRRPGADRPIGKGTDGNLTLVNAIRAYKTEAMDARKVRMKRNAENRRAYLGIQDWSHKQRGQSKEFLPKTPVAVEQFVSFAKRALTQFGPYYEVELAPDSQSPISGEAIRRLVDCHLDEILVEDNKTSSFPVLMSDGLKVGALESLVILKIHGNMVNDRRFQARTAPNGSTVLTPVDFKHWKLRVELLPPENYLPDPTGAGLYEIHTSKRDLSYLVERAEEGIYDKRVVSQIQEDFTKQEEDTKRREFEKGQDETIKPSFRKKVQIDEFWGTIVDARGKVIHRNVFCAIANDKWVLRAPQPNPFWHQESPFLAVPLIRVPFSAWHKALFDHSVQINFAMNELYNLIIDGGLASVWGTRQVRVDDLEDPRQVSEGIPQGETLTVKNTLPHGAKVLETVTEGRVPDDAMAVLEMLSREHAAGSLSNELKLGSLPGKDVRATEVVELSQSQAVTMDGVISDVERELMQKAIKKIWLTMLQNIDDVASDKIVNAIGINGAFALSRMTPAQRYSVFSTSCSFQVFGLSQVLARVRDFQKMMALLQAVSNVPILLQAFFQKYSPDRVLSHMMKMLGINPSQMERDDKELSRVAQELRQLPLFQQLTPGNRGTTQVGGAGAEQTGGPELPAEIASVGNPTAGLAGAGES